MPGRRPMWWVTQGSMNRRPPHTQPVPTPPPPLPPPDLPPQNPGTGIFPQELLRILQNPDSETMLLLLLILLLRQENANKELLIALAYIIL